MRRKTDGESERAAKRVNVPLAMTPELEAQVIETAAAVNLSKQVTMRLSLERGLKILKSQLAPDAAA